MKKFNLLKSMFYRNGRLFMPYVYAFIFLMTIEVYLIVRLVSPLGESDKIKLSDHLIELLLAEIIVLIKVATWGKKNISFDGEEKRGVKSLSDNIPDDLKGN